MASSPSIAVCRSSASSPASPRQPRVAAVLGYVSFYGRIAPMFFAVITLIVALILYQVMGSTADPRYAIGAARLGGYNGMTMVPMPGGELPFLSGAPLSPSGLLYLVGGLLLAVLAFCIALSRSSFGRILQGIRENEQRAELLGFDIRWRKTAIFTHRRRDRRPGGRAVRGLGQLHQSRGLQPAAGRARGHLGAGRRPRHAVWRRARRGGGPVPVQLSRCRGFDLHDAAARQRAAWSSCYSSRKGWRRRCGGRCSVRC